MQIYNKHNETNFIQIKKIREERIQTQYFYYGLTQLVICSLSYNFGPKLEVLLIRSF